MTHHQDDTEDSPSESHRELTPISQTSGVDSRTRPPDKKRVRLSELNMLSERGTPVCESSESSILSINAAASVLHRDVLAHLKRSFKRQYVPGEVERFEACLGFVQLTELASSPEELDRKSVV